MDWYVLIDKDQYPRLVLRNMPSLPQTGVQLKIDGEYVKVVLVTLETTKADRDPVCPTYITSCYVHCETD